jgi:hypothetical protein
VYRIRIDAPEPGRVLTESDTGSSLVMTTRVPLQDGASLVQIATTWDGAGGIGGLFERLFAPRRVMRAINADELERLNAYALEHHPYKPDHPVGGMKGHAWRDQHWQRLRSTR